MTRPLFSFRVVAICSLALSCVLITALLLRLDSLPMLSIAGVVQIVFYILSLNLLRKVQYNFIKPEKLIFWLLLAMLAVVIVKDFTGDYIEIIMQEAAIFANKPSNMHEAVAYDIYLSIRAMDLLVYLLLLGFLFLFLRRFSWQQFEQGRAKIFIILLFCILLALFNYSQPQRLDFSSFFSMYNYFSILLKITIFTIVMYSLMHSKSRSWDLLSSSIIILIAGQFVAYFYYAYHVLTDIEYLPDVTWFLSSFLTFLGLYHMYYYKDYQCENWFVATNSLEAELGFGTFLISAASLIMFFILAYSFELINGRRFLWLFLFVMGYSLAAVFASKQMARSFAKPFTQLQNNMEEMMAAASTPKKPQSFELKEFNFVQNFIYNRFLEYTAQAEKIKAMGQKAVQVAHDIRSPAAAIMMLAKESISLPEEQRISLREASSRVQDIANNLLSDYQEGEVLATASILMLYPVVSSLISEKRVQYRERVVEFNIEAEGAYFAHIKVNDQDFRRLLSNVLNNSLEAIAREHEAKITVEIKIKGQQISLYISDNGPGIPVDILGQLNAGDGMSTKHDGPGLGLKQVREFMLKHKGSFRIESELGVGTKVCLCFKLEKTPCWLAEEISFLPEGEIIILDDDITIHGAWCRRFDCRIKQFPQLSIKYFQEATACLEYLQSLSPEKARHSLFLSDYELIRQDLTGLDLIETIKIGRAILVTSYYDHLSIVKRSILAQAKILPKTLAPEVPVLLESLVEPIANEADLILLDDQVQLAAGIQYLAKTRNKKLVMYSNPYELFEQLHLYSKAIPICLDYDLGLPLTGADIAARLYEKGYTRLYLATGYRMEQKDWPDYLQVLPDKMALLNINC
ncbi:MAG: kinD [Gammaproteobacteria bacterium]|jgi:signal transduction histidine kinase|nr:kinD [Gammaproteobacteria bacterium]